MATAANAHIFEGLVELDPATRKPYLALAKADPTVSADGLTWTVQLRDGAKFSDGTAVTADDVVHSFTRVLKPADPAAPPLMQGFVSFIESVTAKDATTAEFKLKAPFNLFPERIAVIKIVPKAKTADVEASKTFDTTPIGSGPYKLDSASKESGLKFSKNPNYNGPKAAKVETLSWNTTTEASARVADLQGGRVQAIEQVPYLNVDSLKSKYDVEEKQAFNQVFLMFNTSAKPFNDKRVRQALHYAIDKNAVIKTALNGYGTPASSYLDEGNANYQKAATVYDYDAAKAKSLLAAAGASNLSFTLDTTDNAIVKDVAPHAHARHDVSGGSGGRPWRGSGHPCPGPRRHHRDPGSGRPATHRAVEGRRGRRLHDADPRARARRRAGRCPRGGHRRHRPATPRRAHARPHHRRTARADGRAGHG